MAQLVAVVAMYAWLAMTWAGKAVVLMWVVPVAGVRLAEAHRRGLARLERAGLRRHVDRDGVRLEGSPRVSSPA